MKKLDTILMAVDLDYGHNGALCLGLNPKQFAAMNRANTPPGDKRGLEILECIEVLQKQFRESHPGILFIVKIVKEPKQRKR